MFAVIKIGSKQYKVEEGDIIDVDRMASPGKTVKIDSVLLLGDGKTTKIGTPLVAGASVSAEVLEEDRKDKKVVVFKFKPKTGYKRKYGHRQHYTRLRIKSIGSAAAKKSEEPPKKTAAKKGDKE